MLIANYQLVIVFKLNTYCSLYFLQSVVKFRLQSFFLNPKCCWRNLQGAAKAGSFRTAVAAKKVFFCLGSTFRLFFNWAGNPEKSKPAWQGTQSM